MWKPVFKKALILPAAPDEVSKGGIVIAPQAQRDKNIGTVVAVSDDITNDPEINIKEGDEVVFRLGGDTQTEEIDGVEHKVVSIYNIYLYRDNA